MYFDLQLFSEDEGLTIEQAIEKMNGVQEPIEQAETQEEIIETTEEVEEQPETTEPVKEEAPLDYNLKVKFKANGQESELTIAQLIEQAQKGANYERKMQEVSVKEKAFQAAAPQQTDPAKQLEELNNKVTMRAMQLLGIQNPDDFVPDATGLLGSKVHYLAQQKALMDIQAEEHNEQVQRQEMLSVENTYYETVTNFEADPNHQVVYDYAVNAMFQLPQKGKEGVKEFNDMYGIYQKVQQREQYWADMQRFGHSTQMVQPFTKAEVDKLTKFYNNCKTEYQQKQQKEQVKAQVPKNVPIKPTVKVETSSSEPVPAKKIDFKKIREMDIDEIAKML